MNFFILDSIFSKRVVAAFIIFVSFAVFVGICLFLLLKLLQLLLLAVYLTIVIPFFTILHCETSTSATLFGKGSYPVSSFLSCSATS